MVIKKIKQWFHCLIHQAIIDAIEIRRLRMLGRDMKKISDDDQAIWIATAGISYLGIFFVLLAKWWEST